MPCYTSMKWRWREGQTGRIIQPRCNSIASALSSNSKRRQTIQVQQARKAFSCRHGLFHKSCIYWEVSNTTSINWSVFWFLPCFGFAWLVWGFFVVFNCCVNADLVCSAVASSLWSLPSFFPPLLPTLSCWVQSQQRLWTLQRRDSCRPQHNKVKIFAGDQNCAEVEAKVIAWGLNSHQQLPTAQIL